MLGGQLRPDAGQVRLAGRDVTGLSPRMLARLGVGRTFQVAAAFASMTVRENVQTALLARDGKVWRFWRTADRHAAPEADALLARVGMRSQADRPAGVLAYGDLKRLELAVALAGAPALLLMDEPTTGMAPAERAALMALVRDIAKREGVAVLFTEHDMDVVFGHADRVLVLDRGRLIAGGTPAEVRADAQVRAVYLGTAA
jgi:ABC-type branched-subunit amino acid transport system ATPase component